MTGQRFGESGSGMLTAGDKDIAYLAAVYGPSGRWIAFATAKILLLTYSGLALGWFVLKRLPASAGGWVGPALFALAALAIVLALLALVHLFTRKVAIGEDGIELSGGFGMTTRRLRRDEIAGWRAAVEREFSFEEMLVPADVVTLYPKDPGGKRIVLATNAWDFDPDFDHWLASLPRLIARDALVGGDRWEALVHDPLFAPLIAMVALVYGSIMVLAALLVAKVI